MLAAWALTHVQPLSCEVAAAANRPCADAFAAAQLPARAMYPAAALQKPQVLTDKLSSWLGTSTHGMA